MHSQVQTTIELLCLHLGPSFNEQNANKFRFANYSKPKNQQNISLRFVSESYRRKPFQ